MTKEEIVEAIANNKMMPYINPDFLPGIVDYVLDNYKPSLPSNLDEAAIDAAQLDMQDRQIMEATNDERQRYSRIFRRGFKSGAGWLAGQFKTLGETEIYLEDDGGEEPYTQEWLDLATTEFAIPEGFNPGDKVVVQIRKK